jgi:hypothetical protein
MPIARLAAEHFEQHRRPLRIAIDEPYWWFNNVTKEQEASFRKCTCKRMCASFTNISQPNLHTTARRPCFIVYVDS